MKTLTQFKESGLRALDGKWGKAILAEDKSLTASRVLEKSKSIMTGQRGWLFLLQLSFIGWNILSIITLGILSIWLKPFKQSTFAGFYREVSYTRPKPETDEFDHFTTTDSTI